MNTSTTTKALDWPEPATVAHLMWATSRVPARVLRCSQDAITLAMVLPRGARALPSSGEGLTVQWADLRGLHQRPVAMTTYKGGLLHLSPAGDVTSIQRRKFFRATVTIDLRISDGNRELEGVTLDLSEGGARATVEADSLAPSTAVTATMRVGGNIFRVPATVIRRVPRGKRAEVGVAFEDVPIPVANMIRRQVFTAQVEARRNGQRL